MTPPAPDQAGFRDVRREHPEALKTMPNPCKGIPNNAWCKAGKPTVKIPHHS